MKPLSKAVIASLDLRAAVDAEHDAPHAWLPEEPAWPPLRTNKGEVAAAVATQLATGYVPRAELVVNMRKTSFAVRPLAVWWPLDRIVYRALTDRILAGADPLDQSSAAYMTFVNGPVGHATQPTPKPGGGFIVTLAVGGYVVKTDITGYYQYIDHRILAEQLLLLSDDYEAIDALTELLSEVQGRAFGLPQMLQPSDRLADIYIQAVQRTLVRAGRSVWRYNDDFRIACATYIDALRAIEEFAVAARRIGLVLNESKTTISKIGTYISHDTPFALDGDVIVGENAGMLAEDLAADYDELMADDTDPADAAATINSVAPPGTAAHVRDPAARDPFSTERVPIILEMVTAGQIRLLRQALRKLTRLANPSPSPRHRCWSASSRTSPRRSWSTWRNSQLAPPAWRSRSTRSCFPR